MIQRILINLPKKKYVEEIGKEIVLSKYEKYFIKNIDDDYHTKHCIIPKKELKKDGALLKIDNYEFVIFKPDFIDQYKNLRRIAQIIMLKDIGFIIGETGLTRDSVVLDAGLGSGAMACYLAKIVKKVIGYEIQDDHLNMTKQNVKELGINNITIKKGDIYNEKKIVEKNIDVFTLDVPEPWRAVKTAEKVLKVGGYLVSYSPNLNQVQKFIAALPKKLIREKTVEIIEREWLIDELRLRPKTKEVGHTGFMTFARKIIK